jgi:hypothetical protein
MNAKSQQSDTSEPAGWVRLPVQAIPGSSRYVTAWFMPNGDGVTVNTVEGPAHRWPIFVGEHERPRMPCFQASDPISDAIGDGFRLPRIESPCPTRVMIEALRSLATKGPTS